jgi:type IV secretory pathway TrbL component
MAKQTKKTVKKTTAKTTKKVAKRTNTRASTAGTLKTAQAATAPTMPTHEQIRLRAFEVYQRRNGAPGDAFGDWIQAERELTGDSR